MTPARGPLACWLLAQAFQALGVGAFFTFLLVSSDASLPDILLIFLGWLGPQLILGGPLGWWAGCCGKSLLPYAATGALLPLAVALTQPGHWLLAWVLLSAAACLVRTANDRLLPDAALAHGWSQGALQGWRLGFQAGWCAGGIYLANLFMSPLDLPAIPTPLLIAFGSWVVGAFLTLFVDFAKPQLPVFASDPWPLPARRRHRRETIFCLVSLAGIALLAGMVFARLIPSAPEDNPWAWILSETFWLLLALTFGALIAGWQEHPRRRLGYVPWSLSWTVPVLLFSAFAHGPGHVSGVCLALLLGMPLAALVGHLLDDAPQETRPWRMGAIPVVSGAGFLLGMKLVAINPHLPWMWLLLGFTLILAFFTWRWFLREAAECVLEMMMFVMYRLRGRGSGLATLPRHGPLLVIANHSSWFDPVWLGKVLPRRIIPMMTSVFYDLPVMRWMMVNMAEAIRVEAATFRRDVPELAKAVETLDKGECLVLFPEGFLRRKDHQYLRNFGQGVWHILKERPNTPVMVCWIEGGWGSYCSFYKGPPTKNKKMDFRRPVDVAVTEPQLIPEEVLADHRQTRSFLMDKCLQARGLLGLPVPKASEVPEEPPSPT